MVSFSLYLFQNDVVKEFLKTGTTADYEIIQKRKTKVNRELMYLLNSKRYIQSVYLASNNGQVIDTRSTRKQLDNNILKKAKSLKGALLWLFHNITNYDGSSTFVLSLVRIINDIHDITKELGILKINISEQALADLYSDTFISNKVKFYIINKDNIIVSSPQKEEILKPVSGNIIKNEIHENKYGYYDIKMNNEDYLLTYYRLKP